MDLKHADTVHQRENGPQSLDSRRDAPHSTPGKKKYIGIRTIHSNNLHIKA